MTRRALIVHCDPDEAFLAATVLRGALPGMRIVEASDAVSFAAALGGAAAQVAVVARELGWADGLDVIGLLRRQHPDCITILLGATQPNMADPDSQPDAHLSRSTAGLARLGQVVLRAIDLRSRTAGRAAGAAGLDAIPVALLQLSADERALSANAAAVALFGHDDALSLVGRPFAELISQPGDPTLPRRNTSLVAGAAAMPSGLAVVALSVSGAPVPCQLVARTETRDGVLTGFVAALLPQATTAADGMGNMLFAVSHDLQQPLLTTSQSAQMLSDRLHAQARLGTEEERMLRRILSGTARMESLMNGLLDYVRTGQSPLVKAPLALGEVAKDVVQAMQATLDSTGAVVRWHDLPVIVASREQITSLLQNLVANAVKFRGSNTPAVEIACADRGDSWLLSVRDNGIGIDPAQIERVFEPFQRLHTEAEYPGTGIGLAICRRICERHGGRIWATPGPEGGSIFYATISKLASSDRA